MAAPRRVQKVKAGGVQFDVEGLEALASSSKHFSRELRDVMREVLRGPWGREVLEQLRAEVSDSRRTGFSQGTLDVVDHADGGVSVGADPRRGDMKHPHSERANVNSILTWLESGVRPHLIPTRVKSRTFLSFGGRVVRRVVHPGFRARRPMKRTLRVFASEGEKLVLDELMRRFEYEARRRGVPVVGV